MRLFSISFLLIVCSGCVNAINQHTGRDYFQSGVEWRNQDNWFNARMAFGRAVANAEWGGDRDEVKSVYLYEYGRASGVICDWPEAERGLKMALELDQKTGGPDQMALAELARMYHAKGDAAVSLNYFELAMQRYDDLQIETHDAIGYARMLEEYAEVLRLNNETARASQASVRAAEIHKVFPGRDAGHVSTPYGEFCEQLPAK